MTKRRVKIDPERAAIFARWAAEFAAWRRAGRFPYDADTPAGRRGLAQRINGAG